MRDIKVAWPLHLVGGGSTSDDTVLECPESTSGALIFRYARQPASSLPQAQRPNRNSLPTHGLRAIKMAFFSMLFRRWEREWS